MSRVRSAEAGLERTVGSAGVPRAGVVLNANREETVGRASDEPLDALASAARSGDRDAFRELVGRVRVRAFRWALARTGDPDDADDVVQEVLVRVHRHLGAFEGRSGFASWLYRVTANASSTVVSAGRARHEALQTATLSIAESGSGFTESPAGEAISRLETSRLAALVRTFFEHLPPRQREIFQLADLEGYAPREIAAMLEMKPVTVRAHLFKARKAIRRRILAREPELEQGYFR